jgi:hypothetical protein
VHCPRRHRLRDARAAADRRAGLQVKLAGDEWGYVCSEPAAGGQATAHALSGGFLTPPPPPTGPPPPVYPGQPSTPAAVGERSAACRAVGLAPAVRLAHAPHRTDCSSTPVLKRPRAAQPAGLPQAQVVCRGLFGPQAGGTATYCAGDVGTDGFAVCPC